jgi:DNA-directed RNA polymerase specialized sigma24 family protein
MRPCSFISGGKSQLIELRFFGGLGIEETAEALGISPITVMPECRSSRAWLRGEIGQT